ncbi:MAG: hypothetical protein ABR985_03775 [Methanotrichaceae archaeon]|jgi:hypothetical protein
MVAPGLVDRYVDVYLPSKDDKKRWEAAAKEKGLPLSKFIFGTVESVLSAEKETPRFELVQELSDLKEEVQKLSNELKMKNLLLEKLEAEVYKARYASFGEADREGIRRHDEELIAILKNGKTLDGSVILKKLGIDPRDSEAVKLVSNQLETLSRFGLAKETAVGWRWVA